jgi:toxin ParE1/3/4
MRVQYTDTALDEIDKIISNIARENPIAAAEVADAVRETVRRAIERPASAPVVYEGNVRAKMVGRYQYRMYYTVSGDELIVRNVRSTKRQRPWEGGIGA